MNKEAFIRGFEKRAAEVQPNISPSIWERVKNQMKEVLRVAPYFATSPITPAASSPKPLSPSKYQTKMPELIAGVNG